MNDDDMGKQFLALLDEQNNIHWNIVAKLSALIDSKWDSIELRNELETLVGIHTKIIEELHRLDHVY